MTSMTTLVQARRECTDYPGNCIHIVLKVMDSKKRKEKGGPKKARIKKKKTLEEDAAKCLKITDIFRFRALSKDTAGEMLGVKAGSLEFRISCQHA